VSAAPSGDRNIAEALRASLGGGGRFRDRSFEASHEGVGRQHDEEVDRGSDQQEREDGVQEVSNHDVIEGDCAEVGFADQAADDWCEYIFDEGCDYGAECSANDDANSQIEDVSAQNKIPKSFEHVFLQTSSANSTRFITD